MSLFLCSSCQTVSQCGCKGHPRIPQPAETPGTEIPAGQHTERGVSVYCLVCHMTPCLVCHMTPCLVCHMTPSPQSTHPPLHSPKTLVLDLSSPSSLPDKAREALQAFGRVDILVNNAGISSRGAVMDTELSVDRKIMETNFFGTISLTRGIYGCCEVEQKVVTTSLINTFQSHRSIRPYFQDHNFFIGGLCILCKKCFCS